ncbi:MAG TPA: cyclophilin, partial [Alcanivorax sp.]|nr:cyclophilin [Alcanivorax sp.]
LENRRGTIAMARTGNPHSATAQFFINLVDNRSLNHSGKTPRGWGYTVFGEVVEGMDTVDR